jgi:pimeloyl-ACP methyl ester carboxylesterase
MATTELSGTRISYDDLGAGQPAVLLLPGWCAPRWVFRPLLPLISPHRRVLSLDWRGHGDSDAPSGDFGLKGLVDDAAAVLDAGNVQSAVVLALAHSGWAAIELARRLKPRIRGIVSLEWFVLGAPLAFRETLEGMQSPERWRQVVDGTFDLWLRGATDPELVRFVREGMGAFDFPMWARAAREIASSFNRERVPLNALGLLDIPVLHLYAQPAEQVYLDAQRDFALAHPWFSVQRLDARSHFPMFEVPAEIAQAVLRFAEIAGVGAKDSASA